MSYNDEDFVEQTFDDDEAYYDTENIAEEHATHHLGGWTKYQDYTYAVLVSIGVMSTT